MADHPYASHAPRLLDLARGGGVASVIAAIEEESDPKDRRGLFSLAMGVLGREEWPGRSLDATIAIARAGIEEGVRQAEAESDEAERVKRIDFANVLGFNLSADLADCWPADDRPREPRHLAAGLAAAEDCLRWRRELNKGPFPFSIAYWAHGMHSLSLGDLGTARDSFERSLAAAREVAASQERATEAGADATFGVNLGVGYLGLARWRAGEPEGEAQLRSALEAFAAQKEAHPDEESDCVFGIAQLDTAMRRTEP